MYGISCCFTICEKVLVFCSDLDGNVGTKECFLKKCCKALLMINKRERRAQHRRTKEEWYNRQRKAIAKLQLSPGDVVLSRDPETNHEWEFQFVHITKCGAFATFRTCGVSNHGMYKDIKFYDGKKFVHAGENVLKLWEDNNIRIMQPTDRYEVFCNSGNTVLW